MALPKKIGSVTSLRASAMRAVQLWAIELESLQANNSTHPLHRVLEMQNGGVVNKSAPIRRPLTIKDETGERTVWVLSETARSVATRGSPGSKPPLTYLGSRSGDEVHRIMRHIQNIDPKTYEVLMLWGLGYSIADQAKAYRCSKHKVEILFNQGLFGVQSGLLTRQFAPRHD